MCVTLKEHTFVQTQSWHSNSHSYFHRNYLTVPCSSAWEGSSRGSKAPVRCEWLVHARTRSNLLYSVIMHFHTTLWWGICSPCLITRSCCIWQVCGLDVPSAFLFVILSSEENWSHSSIVSSLHSLITEELSQSCELAPIFAFRENVMPSAFNIYLNLFFFGEKCL